MASYLPLNFLKELMKKELILKNEEESKQFAVTLAKQAKKGDLKSRGHQL